jgi:tRNA pseudouridine13 synthase
MAHGQEQAVGIMPYVSPDVPGFQCTIKHRYTDFLVNEVLPDGTVLHLTNDRYEREPKPRNKEGSNGSTEMSSNVEVANGDVESASPQQGLKRQLDDDGNSQNGSSVAKRQRVEEESNINPSVPSQVADLDGEAASSADRKAEIIAGVSEENRTRLTDIFGENTTASILNLYANVILHPDRKPRDQPLVRSEVIAEKAKRTEAHVAIRNVFASKLVTETIQDSPGVIAVRAAPTKGPSGARGQPNANSSEAYQKGKLGWDDLGGQYLHFTLYKENKDTMEVLHFLATQLKIPAKNFQFAGTKDRRGVTVQRVAVFRVYADRVSKLNRMARGWRLGNFEYKKHGLDLGELGGNEFLLTLRDCHFSGEDGLSYEERMKLAKEVVDTAAQSFRDSGYINYYGLQRFGTFSTGTHDTGKKMLQGDLDGAIDSILTYSNHLLPENVDTSGSTKVPQDDVNRADAIRKWRESGSTEATSRMPRRFQAESAIMQYLGKRDRKSGRFLQAKDWQGALMQVQRNLRLMYVHAYQSLVWNNVAGKRWELYGNQVVEGDLVIVGEKDGESASKNEVDEDGEPIFHPAADDSAPTEDSFTRARHLSREEAEGAKYDVFDIVLPLPGYDVLYPANEIGKFYEEFMASEAGGGLHPHKMRRSWKDISLSGGYRKMLSKPAEGFQCEVRSYTGDEQQLVETDLERLEKRTANAGASSGSNGLAKMSNDAEETGGHPKIGVVLKMQLGSSQYATMALRELTKGGAVNYKPDYSSR